MLSTVGCRLLLLLLMPSTLQEQCVGQVVVLNTAGKCAFWDHSFDTVSWCGPVGDDGMRFRLSKRYAFLLCPPKTDPLNGVLRVFPPCFVLNFSGLREVTMKLFIIFCLTMGLMVWRILYVCFHDLLTLQRWVLHRIWIWDQTNTLCGIHTVFDWSVWGHHPSSQVQSFLLLSDLEWLGCTKNVREISDKTGIWICCFLSWCNWSNICHWIHGFHPFGT